MPRNGRNFYSDNRLIGNPDTIRTRQFTIDAKAFTAAEQGIVFPVVHGRQQLAGIHIVPVFDFQSKETTAQGGK